MVAETVGSGVVMGVMVAMPGSSGGVLVTKLIKKCSYL